MNNSYFVVRTIFVLSIIVSFTCLTRVSAQAAPDFTIKIFYNGYIRAINNGRQPLDKTSALRKYLTAGLIQRILKFESEMEADYFVQSQEWSEDWENKFTVSKPAVKGVSATSTVTFPDGYPRVTVTVKKVAGVWKIDRVENSPPDMPTANTKMTATGTLYLAGDGQGIQICQIKTSDGIVEIAVTKNTRVVDFPPDGAAFRLGAVWRAVYRQSKDPALPFEADSVTFIGMDEAVAYSGGTAREFLKYLSADHKDPEKAYSRLTPAAQQRLSIVDFKKLYLPVDFDLRNMKVCSHSDEKVVMLLEMYADETFYQRVEIVPTDQDAIKNEYRINRLFDLEKNDKKAESACRSSKAVA